MLVAVYMLRRVMAWNEQSKVVVFSLYMNTILR